jgi:hypothetical protein
MPYILLIVPFLRVHGMALFPFILIRDKALKDNHHLINHEKIHIRQQLELLILPFYILYIGHYLFNLVKYRNHDTAYRNICFEREAYTQESDLNYLKVWHFWRFLKYF